MQVRNIRPSADVYVIAATGQEVARGDAVTVDDELGLSLCEQTENWAPVGEEATAAVVAHLRRREAEQEEESEGGLSKAEAKRAAAPFEPLPELRNPVLTALGPPAAPEAPDGTKKTGKGVKPAAETVEG